MIEVQPNLVAIVFLQGHDELLPTVGLFVIVRMILGVCISFDHVKSMLS